MHRDDDEYKKRLKEAESIVNSTITNNSTSFNDNYDNTTLMSEQNEYTKKLNEANNIIDSVNMSTSKKSNNEKLRKLTQEFINVIDSNNINDNNVNIKDTSKIQEIEEQPQASESAREAVNVLMNKKKLSSYTTE